ncbi:aldehyde dehydrogenase family protein [Pseudonocardia sp. MCCB 268]|nr:aldehyde dehydrogenase family protein [Pseudonocardia cytotoxica]
MVLDDADLDTAVEGDVRQDAQRRAGVRGVRTSYTVHGRSPATSPRGSPRIADLVVGPGTDNERRWLSPMVSARRQADVTSRVDAAVAQGARVHHRGAPLERRVLLPGDRAVRGGPGRRAERRRDVRPVAPIIEIADDADAVALANTTSTGWLPCDVRGRPGPERSASPSSSSRHGRGQPRRRLRPAAPFGGSKQSGLGARAASGRHPRYLEVSYLAHRLVTGHRHPDEGRTHADTPLPCRDRRAAPEAVWKVVRDAPPPSRTGSRDGGPQGDDAPHRVVSRTGQRWREAVVTADPVLRRFQYRVVGGVLPSEQHLGAVDVIELEPQRSLVVYSTEIEPAASPGRSRPRSRGGAHPADARGLTPRTGVYLRYAAVRSRALSTSARRSSPTRTCRASSAGRPRQADRRLRTGPEALLLLVADGLVEMLPGRGTYVPR